MAKNKNFQTKERYSSSISFLITSIVLINLYFNTQYADPFNTPKMLLLLLTSCWLLGHIVFAIKNHEISLKSLPSKAIVLGIIFLLFMLFSVFNTKELVVGLAGDQQRRLGWLTYFGFVIFFIFSALRVNYNFGVRILKAAVLNHLVLSIYAMFQITGNDFVAWNNPYNAIIGTLGNPNFASATLSILSCLSITALLCKDISRIYKLMAVISLILGFLAIILSESRQGLVSFLFAFLFFVSLYFYFNDNKFKYIVPIISLVLILFALMGMLQKGPLSSILYKPSVTLRGYYWDAGINMFLNKPFTGIGVDSYERYFLAFRDLEYPLKYGFEISSSNAHNVLIQLFATCGLFVGFSYLIILLFILITGLKLIKKSTGNRRILALGFTSAWIAFQSQALISIDNIGLTVWGWVLGGIIIGLEHSSSQIEGLNNKISKTSVSLLQPLASFMFLIPVIIIVVLLHRSETNTLQLQKISASTGVDFKLIDKVSSEVYNNPFSLPQYKLLSVMVLSSTGETIKVEKMIQNIQKSSPRLLNAYYSYIQVHSNDINIELDYRSKISNIDPWNLKNYLRIIELSIIRKDQENLKFNLDRILSLAPNSAEAKTAQSLVSKYNE
jgi:O-antigen ligase